MCICFMSNHSHVCHCRHGNAAVTVASRHAVDNKAVVCWRISRSCSLWTCVSKHLHARGHCHCNAAVREDNEIVVCGRMTRPFRKATMTIQSECEHSRTVNDVDVCNSDNDTGTAKDKDALQLRWLCSDFGVLCQALLILASNMHCPRTAS